MIHYGKQSIDQSDIDAVLAVLKSDQITQGVRIEEFETALKIKFEAKHCCAVSSGTAALHLAGLALGWGQGDIVITSPITFLASANCILYAGATPDFVDIDPFSYTIDPNQLEDKIKSYRFSGKRVKALIGVDYAGHPCDWKALRSLAEKYELQLVNDNCHAMGASYFNDTQYAVQYADVVIQSYHPVKHITTGEGGALLTNADRIDAKARLLRSHGMTKDPNHLEKYDGPWYYEMHEPGFNYRITDFQCALGSSQLKKLDQFVEQRRRIASLYDRAFRNHELILSPRLGSNVQHAYHLYPIQIEFAKTGIEKNKCFDEMKCRGIQPQVHYIPVHTQPYYQKTYGFRLGDYPNAERFYRNEMTLPIYPSLSPDDIQKVIHSLLELVSR